MITTTQLQPQLTLHSDVHDLCIQLGLTNTAVSCNPNKWSTAANKMKNKKRDWEQLTSISLIFVEETALSPFTYDAD